MIAALFLLLGVALVLVPGIAVAGLVLWQRSQVTRERLETTIATMEELSEAMKARVQTLEAKVTKLTLGTAFE